MVSDFFFPALLHDFVNMFTNCTVFGELFAVGADLKQRSVDWAKEIFLDFELFALESFNLQI